MQVKGMKKFLDALKTAGINRWGAQLDNYVFENDPAARSFCYFDEANTQVVNICRNNNGLFGNKADPFLIRVGDINDIHELRVTGDIDEVKAFIKAYGIEKTKELDNIIVKIESNNFGLKPPTGDYHTFKILSESELAELDDEAREKYQKDLEEYRKYEKKTNPPVSVR